MASLSVKGHGDISSKIEIFSGGKPWVLDGVLTGVVERGSNAACKTFGLLAGGVAAVVIAGAASAPSDTFSDSDSL